MAEIVQTVMVSSTALDLPRHRDAVLKACLTLGMKPVMMEHLSADHRNAVDVSLEMVEKADLYVGIFASRYGYIPEGSDVSITELEYHCAIDNKKPTLIFFAAADHPSMGLEDESQESRQKLARLKKELLAVHIVQEFSSAEDLNGKVRDSLYPYRDSEALHPDVSPKLSKTLSDNLQRLLNQKIDTLTQDQYTILKSLAANKRYAIEGCAGSGKTMLAAQKALMLPPTMRILILCHSHLLAEHIRELVQGANNIWVYDFPGWIAYLNGEEGVPDEVYSAIGYVDDQKLNAAFDRLEVMNQKYDAIIVDEGQDFREDLWWLFIEGALKSVEDDILYVFYDSYQELHTGKVKFPIPQAPYKLVQNVRNAGKIFHLVEAMYPNYVESFSVLEEQGILGFQEFSSDEGNERAALTQAVQTALRTINAKNLVVLTTEYSAAESTINQMEVLLPSQAQWQEAVRWYLGDIELSDALRPTQADIQRVVKVALERFVAPPAEYAKSAIERVKWQKSANPLRLNREDLFRIFFASDRWAEGLPEPKFIRVTAETGTPNSISLYTVSAFKGLESDGVILFIHSASPGRQEEFERHLYVGLSRAKLLLYVVYDKAMTRKIPYKLRHYFYET